MENKEPEHKAMPRRQFHTSRHGSPSLNTIATLRRHVPMPMRASHQDPTSRTKTRPRPGAMHLCLGMGSFPSPANPAPRPRPGVLHQRPSVGFQAKSRNQSSMTHAQAWSLKYRRESAYLAGRKSYPNLSTDPSSSCSVSHCDSHTSHHHTPRLLSSILTAPSLRPSSQGSRRCRLEARSHPIVVPASVAISRSHWLFRSLEARSLPFRPFPTIVSGCSSVVPGCLPSFSPLIL
ncbi:hypothetical protein PIB30_099283, partial [Stylosanthes scabra]|nr:hypothetical protein [Stylosanthes scabra]